MARSVVVDAVGAVAASTVQDVTSGQWQVGLSIQRLVEGIDLSPGNDAVAMHRFGG